MKRVSALIIVVLCAAMCGCDSLRGGVVLDAVTSGADASESAAGNSLIAYTEMFYSPTASLTKKLTEKHWYNCEDLSEEWIFTDETVTVNGEELPCSVKYPLLQGLSVIIGETTYRAYEPDGETVYLIGKSETISLCSSESEEYKRFVRTEKVEQSAAELLKRYPDNDGWLERKNCGDIPLLASADIIDEALNYGAFIVTTPEELASAVWAVNTMTDIYFPIKIDADIDLSGYEWAPMGWNGGANDHPFNGAVIGEGHTISNMTINSDDSDVGFIGWETFCYVGDLTFDGARVRGGCNVGVVSGQAIGGVYEGITIKNSTVDGSTAGSMLGWDANTSKKNCSADVIVNGKEFPFLSYNDKEKSEIVIENPVEITLNEQTHEVTRPEVEGYHNLGWMVFFNGEQVLHRNAENELSYTYFLNEPGYYEIYLTAYVQGQYVPISNTVSYTIN
ncbi:MAG: hypothetical protein ACI4XA_11310 [Oscillospiraceae bacterium]